MKRILVLFLFLSASAKAEEPGRHWLVPDHFPLQYAGNIGFASAGFGYGLAHDKLEMDFMYGYVPKDFGGPLNSISLKSTWIPFKPVPMGALTMDFFSTGLVLNYSLGEQFFFIASTQDRYPARYYDHSSALRFGIFI